MSLLVRISSLWRHLFRRPEVEKNLEEEIEAYVEMLVKARIKQGSDPAEARRAVLIEIEGIEQIKEEVRAVSVGRWLDTLWRDLRYGLRMLRRSPGVSLLAIMCLTVGIGATTAVFSWIEGILLRPFPAVANQNRLVALTGTDPSGRTNVSWPDFQDLQKNCSLVEAFIAERIFGTTLSIGDRAERASGSIVSANYFRALGIHPIMGRGFEPGEDAGRNAHPVTVISYQAWRDRYGADREIIGKTQMLNGVPHTIIGVAPEGFYGTFVGYSFQFWVPASMEEVFESGGYKLENRGARWIEGFALLKPGVTLDQAQAEMSAVAKRLENDFPATNRNRGIKLFPLWQTPFNGAGTLLPTLRIALVVSCFVLLIACANVGNLLIFRSLARGHEMTVRLAIGAGRGRLVRQLLTEGLILSSLACAGGLLFAYWCRNVIVLLFGTSPGIIVNLPADMDWRVVGLSAAVCLLSTLMFALLPAWQATKIDLAGAMKYESGTSAGGRGKSFIRSSLVLVQVSLSFLLLVGAGLLLKSMQGMRNLDPGFSLRGVLVTSVDFIAAGYDPQRAMNTQDELMNRIQTLPGVESVTASRITPFSYRSYSSAPIAVEGLGTAPGEEPVVEYNEVGPRYFTTLGIPMMSGREFTRADNETGASVAVVNEAMAAQYWRGEDPVGKRLRVNGRWVQVVGVAKNLKYRSLLDTAKPFFYVPARQSTLGQGLQIRTSLAPEAMAPALAREVRALDPNLAPGEVITMREQVDRATWSQRAAVILLGAFSGVALMLAAIGLYGVMSYAVSQNTRQFGLRIALGAEASDLLRLVMSRGFVLTASGMSLGTLAALATTGLMGDLLYKVSPRDPFAFVAASLVMIIASLVACFMPAWRAMRIDPVRALKD